MFEHKVVITKPFKGDRVVEEWLERQFGPEGMKWQISYNTDSLFRVVFFYSERYKTMFQIAFSHCWQFETVEEGKAWFQDRLVEMVKNSKDGNDIQSGGVTC